MFKIIYFLILTGINLTTSNNKLDISQEQAESIKLAVDYWYKIKHPKIVFFVALAKDIGGFEVGDIKVLEIDNKKVVCLTYVNNNGKWIAEIRSIPSSKSKYTYKVVFIGTDGSVLSALIVDVKNKSVILLY